MTEPASTREGGKRQIKPSRYYLHEEPQLLIGPGSRQNDHRERLATNQLKECSKLLVKFITSINKSLLNYLGAPTHHPTFSHPQLPPESKPQSKNKPQNKGPDPTTKKTKDQFDVSQGKPYNKESKNKNIMGKPSSNFQAHNNYQALQSHRVPLNKAKNITNGLAQDRTLQQRTKPEGKPFKRQSYHVAIAYHIHLKVYMRNGSNMDPTTPARRLRQGDPNYAA